MPKYTRNGVTIRSDKELSAEQLEEAFGLAGKSNNKELLKDKLPPDFNGKPDENNLGQDILEGAGLPSRLNQVPDVLASMGKNILNPVGESVKAGTSIFNDAKSRTGRYWDTLSDDPSIPRAAQLAMAPVPFVGNAMENADKAITEDDPHAGGRLGGNILALLSPKMGEMGAEVSPIVKAAGGGLADAGKFVATNPTARGLAVGAGTLAATHSPIDALLAGMLGQGKIGRLAGGIGDILDSRSNAASSSLEEGGIAPLSDSPNPSLGKVKPPNKTNPPNPVSNNSPNTELPPVPSITSKLEEVPTFPTRYKNIRLKDIPTPPNPPSNPYSEPPSTGNVAETADPHMDNFGIDTGPIKLKGASKLKTADELEAVQNLVDAGIDRDTAVNIIIQGRSEVPTSDVNPVVSNDAPTVLNSREQGTSPRQLGVDRRSRGVSPRQLAEKRKGL